MEQETLALAGWPSSGKQVRRVLVSVNGVEVSRQEPRRSIRRASICRSSCGRDRTRSWSRATDADGMTQQEVRTVYYEKPSPLAVSFRYPEDRSRVTEESSVVAAVVTSSKGIAKVSVQLNGVEVHQQSDKSPQPSVAVSAPVTLKEGANAIVVTATEAGGADPAGGAHGHLRQAQGGCRRGPARRRPPPPPVKSDRWAVIIGVGRYQSTDIPSLRYTVSDAESLYQLLIGPGGFKKEHVLLLTDKIGPDADPSQYQVGAGDFPRPLGEERRYGPHLLRRARSPRGRSARRRA